ncbi:hypothetical protein [Rhodococcus aetherivorans]
MSPLVEDQRDQLARLRAAERDRSEAVRADLAAARAETAAARARSPRSANAPTNCAPNCARCVQGP